MTDSISLADPVTWAGLGGLLIIACVLWIDHQGTSRGRGASTGLGRWEQWKPVLARKQATRLAERRIPDDAGAAGADKVVFLGYAGKHPLFIQHEDTVLTYGIPRSGKTRHVALRAVADAVGPVVATSTKTDLAAHTMSTRADLGQVWVYDPMTTMADSTGITRLTWDPVVGCEDPEVALRRAAAWAAAQPLSNVKNGDWFNQRASELLAPLLHAAALGHYDIVHVQQWAQDLDNRTPRDLLHDCGPRGWAQALEATSSSRAGETVDSLKMTLSGVMGALASPQVAATLTPTWRDHFDIDEFLNAPNTLFLLADQRSGSIIAPVFTMLLDEILTRAAHLSQTRPGGYLWPPLRVVGDEIANLAPVRNLEGHMSDSGGRGIQLMPIVQSHAQMKQRWGEDGAEAIRAAATAKLYLPGTTEADLTRDLERIAGRRRVSRVSTSTGRQGGSTSRSHEWEDVLPQAKVADLEQGWAWLQYRALPIGKVRMPAWEAPKTTPRRRAAA